MPNRLMHRLAELAAISDTPGAITRLYLSPAHARAIPLVESWMREAGLETQLDATGTLIGRTPSPADAPTLLLGSHIDTVRDAGAYDGNFGVLAAIEAISLAGPLPFAVEILAFGDEEGVRFPATLSGSRAIAGNFNPQALDGKDDTGLTLREALTSFGLNPENIPAIARDPAKILGYIELHIEQGPVLEAKNLPVGIVTAINGAARFTASLTGAAGHAGTIPMAMRHDALTAAAEQILAIETAASAIPNLVATVGSLALHPGAPNSVPGRVTYSIDIRSPSDAPRHAAITRLTAQLTEIATRRGLAFTLTQTHEAPATECALWLQQQLAHAVEAQQLPAFHLPSGAGHDAMAIAPLCPVAMLFTRCKGGISHTPEESITEQDAATATQILVTFLQNFKQESSFSEEKEAKRLL